MVRIPRLVLAVALLGAVTWLPGSATAKDTSVGIRDSFFGKPLVVVTVGDTVTWRNQGDVGHTVVAYPDAPRTFDSSPRTEDSCRPLLGSADCVDPGQSYGVTFTRAGTYDYFCKIAGHADTSVRPDPGVAAGNSQPCGMCGRVVVNEKPPPPEPTDEPERPSEPTTRPSPSASPSEDASASPSPTATQTGPDGSPIAIDQTSGGGDGGGRLALAFGAILVLGGTGYFVWRKFLNA